MKVKINGKKQIIKLRIDESLMKEDKAILEDLIIESVNNANKKVDAEINNKMIRVLNDLGIPSHFISMFPFIDSK